MHELRLPKLNNNDDRYTIVEWCFPDGARVPADAVVAVIESSKVAEDLVVPGPGILHRVAPAGADRAVGEVIGYLFADEHEREQFQQQAQQQERARQPEQARAAGTGAVATPVDELIITAPARQLIEELGLGPEHLRSLGMLGKQVIKRADVAALKPLPTGPAAAEPAGPAAEPAGDVTTPVAADATVHRLPHRQRVVADLVARSHATIPAAYVAVDIYATATPAQVIKAVGTLRERFPLHFGSYRGDGTVVVPKGAAVAVTMDAGNGLFMPVVADAGARSVDEITDTLDRYRRKATDGTFTAAELAGGNIGLSLHTYTGVVAAQPVVFPGHACMLALCPPRREVVVDRAGAVSTRPVFQLGMSYDHRVVNGRDAVRFLRAIKSIFERPARRDAAAARPASQPAG